MTDCLSCGHDIFLVVSVLCQIKSNCQKLNCPECTVFPVYSVYSVCLSCTPPPSPRNTSCESMLQ